MLGFLSSLLPGSRIVHKHFSYYSPDEGRLTFRLSGTVKDVRRAVESIRSVDPAVGPYKEWKDDSELSPEKKQGMFRQYGK